jgi:lipoate-protein ligase A
VKVYKLGRVGNLRSTTLFHAFARAGLYGLILVEPDDTYLSLGYFDNLQQVVDLERAKALNIPIIRREVGGGTVLLSRGQVFYQLVVPKSLAPFKVEDAYKKFSQPVMETYRQLGIEVEYRPINDIITKATKRKISGQGAGDIGKAFVFVGNILLRFDTQLMAELLKVPDKELLKSLLDENISWVERETGKLPDFWDVAKLLEKSFRKVLPLEREGEVPQEILELADKLKEELTSEETLFEDTGRNHKLLKIREGVFLERESLRILRDKE